MAPLPLPEDIDATYSDSGDFSIAIHQQHHDTIHSEINKLTVVTANNQTGTTYTLALTDAGKVVELNAATAVALKVPTNAVAAFPVGACVELWQQGAGQVTVSAVTPGTTTVRSPAGKVAIAAQYGSATLRKRATDEWCLEGNLA